MFNRLSGLERQKERRQRLLDSFGSREFNTWYETTLASVGDEGANARGHQDAANRALQVELALEQLESAEDASQNLARATWVLVLATLVLALATIVLAVRA